MASHELDNEPGLAGSVVSNTITDLDNCTSTEDVLQHMCTPSDLVSVVAMMDRLVSNDSLDPSLSTVACSVVATIDMLVRFA